LPNLRLASISLRTHRPAEGVQFAEHAVRMAPDSGEAHYILGKAYLALGEDIAAIAE